jgi:hypothetical protein
MRDGLRLEQIVHERPEQCRQRDHESQVSQERLALQLRPRPGAVRVGGMGATRWHAFSHGDRPGDTHCTHETQQWEKRAFGQEGRDTLGAHATDEAAERSSRGHTRHQRLRRMRVEAFVEQRPERGDRNPAQHTGVQVEEHCRGARLWTEKHPLDQEQCRVRPDEDGSYARRPTLREQPSRHLRCGDGKHGCTGHEVRQALNGEEGQEQPVADGVRANLLCDERRRCQRRDQLGPETATRHQLPICSSSRVASTRASSYS